MPATCPYPEPHRSSPYPHIPLSEDPSNIILPSTSGSSKWSLSPRFPHQNPVWTSPLFHAFHMIALLILLDLIIRIIFGNEYRSWSYSFCLLLQRDDGSSIIRPKYLPQLSILDPSQSVFLPQCDRPTCRLRKKCFDHRTWICSPQILFKIFFAAVNIWRFFCSGCAQKRMWVFV